MTVFRAHFQAAHDAQAIAALRADARASRDVLRAALDQLHAKQMALTRLRDENSALRDELRRYTAQQTSGA